MALAASTPALATEVNDLSVKSAAWSAFFAKFEMPVLASSSLRAVSSVT
jgi:hypothetical protein